MTPFNKNFIFDILHFHYVMCYMQFTLDLSKNVMLEIRGNYFNINWTYKHEL